MINKLGFSSFIEVRGSSSVQGTTEIQQDVKGIDVRRVHDETLPKGWGGSEHLDLTFDPGDVVQITGSDGNKKNLLVTNKGTGFDFSTMSEKEIPTERSSDAERLGYLDIKI